MLYYKIIVDNVIMDVGTSLNFARYSTKHHIIMYCSAEKAEYLVLDNGSLFHADWMRPIQKGAPQSMLAEISSIEWDEYEALKKQLASAEQGISQEEPILQESPQLIASQEPKVYSNSNISLHIQEIQNQISILQDALLELAMNIGG